MLLPWLLLLSTEAYKVKESEEKEGRITNVDIFCIYSKWEGPQRKAISLCPWDEQQFKSFLDLEVG